MTPLQALITAANLVAQLQSLQTNMASTLAQTPFDQTLAGNVNTAMNVANNNLQRMLKLLLP